jgi:hypothetical protein
MNHNSDLDNVRTTSSVEALLLAAADYEPNPPMPDHIEERAVRRIVRLRQTQQHGRVMIMAWGVMLTAILGRYALTRTRHHNPGAGRCIEVLVSRSPGVSTVPELRAFVPKVTLAGTRPVRMDTRLRQNTLADHRAYDHGIREPHSAVLMGPRRIAFTGPGLRRYPPAARTAAPAVHHVWRTEVLETDTVGYFAPALLAKPDKERSTITFTAVALAVPVTATQSIFRSNDN